MKKILISISAVVLIVAIGFSIFIDNTNGNAKPLTEQKFALDTICYISLYDHKDQSLLDDAFNLISNYENLFSSTIPESDISKINAANGKPVTVSDNTVELLNDAIYYGDLSNGMFDVTIGAVSSLWDFTSGANVPPDPSSISAALTTVDYNNVVINGNEVYLKNPETQLDLGGIAKGFIAQKVKGFLTDNGVTSAIINLGGNVVTLGSAPDGKPWNIGVLKPFSDDQSETVGTVSVTDKAVVTSGSYQRYFIADDGTLYFHILDPTTGYPVQTDLLSATIICDDSTEGDALSTITFEKGLDDGMKFIESLDGVEAIFVTSDYKVFTTSGISTTDPTQEIYFKAAS